MVTVVGLTAGRLPLNHEPTDKGSDGSGKGTGSGHDDDPAAPDADSGAQGGSISRRNDPASLANNGELDPAGGAGLNEPELIEVVRQLRTISRTFTRSWSGPLPHPAELRQYDDIIPGGAERILRMSEKALDSQVTVDTTLAKGDTAAVKRGQFLSAAVVVLSLLIALFLAWNHAPWPVVALFVAPPLFEFSTSLVRAIQEPRKAHNDPDDSAAEAQSNG